MPVGVRSCISPVSWAPTRTYRLTSARRRGGYGSGALDHVSLRCEGLESVQIRLQSLGIAFRERVIPQIGEHQLFLEDPNGITIEMIFDYVPGARIVGQAMANLAIGPAAEGR